MYRNVKLLSGAIMMVAIAGMAATRAEAAIIVQTGLVGGSGDVDNVLFGPSNCDGVSDQAGTTIQGCLNTDSSYLVDFTSDEEIFSPSSGQARLESTDGGFSFLQIAPLNGTFSKLQLNVMASEAGSIFFTGSPGGDSSVFALTGNGQNFFTITGDDEFTWVAFNTTTDIVADVRQVRLGAGDGSGRSGSDSIPEPTSLVLFGLGMLGAGMASRRIRL